jgi:FKBP-type peptidyl-prolyl cis-trans isomerase 2
MTPAQPHDTVCIHYTGTLDDGCVFDTSRAEGRAPLEFVLGAGAVIAGFDAAVTGMVVGEVKTVTIPPAQAYGERRDELLQEWPRAELPEGYSPTVGDVMEVHHQEQEQPLPVTVVAFDDHSITLDANHVLAGKALTFELELVSIATP